MPLRRAAAPRKPKRWSVADALRHDRGVRRRTQWRLHLLVYAVVNILVVQLVVLAFLPAGERTIDLTLFCVALVFTGAMPVAASAFQSLVIGLHRFRIDYRRLRPYYPRTGVIVPAWNEGAVIGNTIDHLLAMEYPADRIRVYIVDDASTDETPDIVQAKAIEHPDHVFHVRREHGGQGKAHTLNAGIDRILSDDWAQAILIIDADVLFERDALRKMARHLSDPRVGAVTAYIKEGTPNGNYLTRFIGYEYITAQAAARRAQNVLGALACLAGGAQLHSRQNMIDIGGRIDTSTLAEDTVTTFATQHTGKRAVFEGNAVVWAEEPSDPGALWKQRLRWGRGNVEISVQFAQLWAHVNGFGRLAGIPFKLLWFTVLLMPIIMLGSAAGLIGLYFINAPRAWEVFRVLWVWNLVVYLFQTGMAFAIDPGTARKSWVQGLLFPGIISLVIMAYSAYPPLYDVTIVTWLHHRGILLSPILTARATLFMYAWCFLCIPAAYMGKLLAQMRGCRWLAPFIIYVVGYGPFLCAVTFAAYLKEVFNVSSVWDKTVKTGVVSLPAAGGS
jgi:cellulose synthase/poly-beta-1,6-N-acetylglucosamine synthase-like glycosyltransferase